MNEDKYNSTCEKIDDLLSEYSSDTEDQISFLCGYLACFVMQGCDDHRMYRAIDIFNKISTILLKLEENRLEKENVKCEYEHKE